MKCGDDIMFEESLRPLRCNASRFEACLLDDSMDVDLEALKTACSHFADVLEHFGYFSVVMVQEVHSNMDKIEGSALSCLGTTEGLSMRRLLISEIDMGMHGPGAQVGDPSAGVGLLWTRRGLHFWTRFFELWVDLLRKGTPVGNVPLRTLAEAAHLEVLMPFHGWMSRGSFAMVTQALPASQVVATKLSSSSSSAGGDDDKTSFLQEDLAAWVAAVNPVLCMMEKVQQELGLEDKGKSY